MKAKSLIDVTVETAFRFFPIDDERYDLIIKLAEIASALLRDESLVFHLQSYETVDIFLKQTSENFSLHAFAYARWVTRESSDFPTVIEDRAVRVYNSFSPCNQRRIQEQFGRPLEELRQEMYIALWLELAGRMMALDPRASRLREINAFLNFLHDDKGEST